MAGYPPDYSNSGFRYFSKPFNTQHAVQSFNLQWDPSLVWYNGEKLSTGGWKPLTAGPVAITGGSINIGNNVTIGNTVTTNSTVTNAVPIAISGTVKPFGSSSVIPLGPSGTYPYTGLDSSYRITGQIIGANSARNMLFVQNVHTGLPLYVSLSQNAASTSNFSMILNPSTREGWGGSSFANDHYKGAVCVSGGGWTAWEM